MSGLSRKTPEQFVDEVREDLGNGLRDLFDDEIGRLESEDERSPAERRVAKILEDLRDRLVGEPRLTQDRNR